MGSARRRSDGGVHEAQRLGRHAAGLHRGSRAPARRDQSAVRGRAHRPASGSEQADHRSGRIRTAASVYCGAVYARGADAARQALRTVSQRPKVVLFIGTYVRTFEPCGRHVPAVIPGRITPSYLDDARDDRLSRPSARCAPGVRARDGRGQHDGARARSRGASTPRPARRSVPNGCASASTRCP